MQGRHSATAPYPPFYCCRGFTGMMVASHETDLGDAIFPHLNSKADGSVHRDEIEMIQHRDAVYNSTYSKQPSDHQLLTWNAFIGTRMAFRFEQRYTGWKLE